MALEISLDTPIQSNDNTVIKFTDNTGIYAAVTNVHGWGSPNTAVSDIDGVTHTLELLVSITTSSGTQVDYEYIDLYDEFGPFTTVNDLEFAITSDILLEGTDPLGTTEDVLPDGWYEISYVVDRDLAGEDTFSYQLLVDGNIRLKVDNALRELPYLWNTRADALNSRDWETLLGGLKKLSYFNGMLADVTTAKEEEVLDILGTLEDICLIDNSRTQ